jgi:hypothetical protein
VLAELDRIVSACEACRLPPDPLGDDGFLDDLALAYGTQLPFGVVSGVVPARLPEWLAERSELAVESDERPWVDVHLNARRAKELTDDWMRLDSVALLADFYRANPAYAGLFGVGWLAGASVGDSSPHLGFIRQLLDDGGARIVSLGAGSPQTIANATMSSPTRRRLYDEGRWTPTDDAVVWLRDPFLRWVDGLGLSS